jgi:hypothetical protein
VPFSHIKSDPRVIHYVISGGRPKRERSWQINEEIWGMLETCWDTEPIQRPSMAALSRFFALQDSLVAAHRARL